MDCMDVIGAWIGATSNDQRGRNVHKKLYRLRLVTSCTRDATLYI